MERYLDVVTGFFESGKTRFINDNIKNSPLIISSEKGIEKYREGVIYIDSVKEIPEIIKKMEPDYVVVEYNGFWKIEDILKLSLPNNFTLRNIISVIDTDTFDNYIQNMPKVMVDKIRNSDVVILNPKMKLLEPLRRKEISNTIKNINPACKIGKMEPIRGGGLTRSDLEILKFCLLVVAFYGGYFLLNHFYEEKLTRILGVSFGLIIQILPFLVLGAVLSSIIQIGLRKKSFEKVFKKTSVVNVLIASVLGIFFPVCDCAMVPIASSLIKKKYSVPVVFAFLIASPALNPIVIISTYYAFSDMPEMVVYRSIATLLIAWITSAVLFFLEKEGRLNGILKDRVSYNYEEGENLGYLDMIVFHTKKEFFRIGSFVIVGAFLSAIIQVLVSKQVFISLNKVNFLAVISMIIASFFISVCSTSNAFIARSFINAMPLNSILAFLVMGPIFDITNLSAMFSVFKKGFMFRFILSLMYLAFIGFSFIYLFGGRYVG